MKVTRFLLATALLMTALTSVSPAQDRPRWINAEECHNPDNAKMKYLYLLVSSQASYSERDAFPVAFEHDFKRLRTAWINFYREISNDTIALSHFQPAVHFRPYYYNVLESVDQQAEGLCRQISALRAEAVHTGEYFRLNLYSTLAGSHVVARALETCIPALHLGGRVLGEPARGEPLRNIDVFHTTTMPDPLLGYRPAKDGVYPFVEYDLFRLLADPSFRPKVTNGYISAAPDYIETWDFAPSLLQSPPPPALYPWLRSYRTLPRETREFRRVVATAYSGETVRVCVSEDYCFSARGKVDPKCRCLELLNRLDLDLDEDLALRAECGVSILHHPQYQVIDHFQGPSWSAFEGGNLLSELFEAKGFGNNDRPQDPSRPICGDGVLGIGEECDDGNRVSDDDCDNNCKRATCGDAKINAKEECDPGSANMGRPDINCQELITHHMPPSQGPNFCFSGYCDRCRCQQVECQGGSTGAMSTGGMSHE